MKTFDALAAAVLAELEQALRSVDAEQVRVLNAAILDAPRVFVAGKGRSGLRMSAFGMRLMHLGLPAHVVGEMTTPAIGAGDMLVIGSGSGRTASLVQYAQQAKTVGARVGLVTIADSSPLGNHADHVVRIAAASPKIEGGGSAISAQPMANLFEQALGLLLDIMVVQMMDELKMDSDAMFQRHANLE